MIAIFSLIVSELVHCARSGVRVEFIRPVLAKLVLLVIDELLKK